MKRFWFVILFLTSWFSAFSQIDEDVEIISSPSEDKKYVYPDVDFEIQKPSEAVKTKRKNPLLSPILTRGWRLFAEFGLQKAVNDYTCDVIDFSCSLGWQFIPQFYAGMGVAEQAYADYWYFGTYSTEPNFALVLPLFFDFRYDCLKKKVTPFIECRIGYAATDDEYNNYSGFYYSPSAGLRLWKFNISVGAEYVKLDQPWHFLEIVDGHRQFTTIKTQASYMIKLSYEWGGNF
ncbi:MAG: hypothetical protein II956_09530 [Bacteroidales bacterium]|nr:hypothetical protein [Bacteroidales bacterium]